MDFSPIDAVVRFFQRRFRIGAYKRLQWTLDEQLQLHPLAYEAAGQGTWTGGTSSVPTTKPEDQLGIPNGVDRDHPRLEPRRNMMDSGVEDPLMNQSLRDGKVPGCYAAETTYPEP